MRKIGMREDRHCIKCKLIKPHYIKPSGKAVAFCISCKAEYNIKHYELTKEKYRQSRIDTRLAAVAEIKKLQFEKKRKPCMDCGMSYPPYIMQFDHRDPSEKSFSVAARRHGIDKIKLEIEKCDLVCANCHAERTHGARFREKYGNWLP